MKKIVSVYLCLMFLAFAVPAMAVEKGVGIDSKASSGNGPKVTIFNDLSNFFKMFDRPMARQGNKQNIGNATADWIKNIDK